MTSTAIRGKARQEQRLRGPSPAVELVRQLAEFWVQGVSALLRPTIPGDRW